MKLICQQNVLLEYLNIATKAVASKSTIAILECLLLQATEQAFTITSNNLELGIHTTNIPAQIQQAGSIAVDAKLFIDIVRRFKGECITIESNHDHAIIITDTHSCFTIMGKDGKDFPQLPMIEREQAYTLTQPELKNLLKQTVFSIATESSKPILTGECLQIKKDCMYVVSVDGYRISLRKKELSHMLPEKSVVIPGKTAQELIKILSQEEDQMVQLYFTNKHVLFDLGIAVVVSRLLEGEFLHYENNFTKDFTTKMVISVPEFLESLERACLVSRENRKTPVQLQICPNTLIITAKSEWGTAHEEIPMEMEGDELQIAFNPRYLIEALRATEEETVVIRFTGSLSPCIIAPIDGDAYQYLILPLRM